MLRLYPNGGTDTILRWPSCNRPSAINYKVAIDLRHSQAQRIKAQQGPDSAAYPPRKKRKELKGKKGRIKRQKAVISAKHMKVKTTGDQIEVGFFDWVAPVAHVHQFDQPERVRKKRPTYKYPEWPLLGLSKTERISIRESLLRHMVKN